MASRLKLRKKKYHPPLQEGSIQSNIEDNKTSEELMNSNKNVNILITNPTNQKNPEELKKRNMKTYAQITGAKAQIQKIGEVKKSSLKTYAQTATSSSQVYDENEIFKKAIESAKKHNIKLKAGRKDRGYGDCAFEAVINNINDRACFTNKLVQTPNWYRRLWMDQMMERIILGICPWNLGYTEHQLREGFDKLKMTGVYEIDFFGDMMLGGIACGIKKRILIFNTSDNLLHDPISVVDPQHYDVRIKVDDETPIVVAYNNYHYENLHPVDERDRLETLRLVNSYINGRYELDYGLKKEDIRYVLSPSLKNISQEVKPSEQKSTKSSTSRIRQIQSNNSQEKQSEKCIQDQYYNAPEKLRDKRDKQYNNLKKPEKQNNKANVEGLRENENHKHPWITVSSKEDQKENIGIPLKDKAKKRKISGCILNSHNKTYDLKPKADNPVEEIKFFEWGNIKFEEMENKKMRCGICQIECLRLISHINGSAKCRNRINMVELKNCYNKYNQRKRIKKSEQKKKENYPVGFREEVNKRIKKSEQKKKENDPDGFREEGKKRKKKQIEKQRAEDLDGFREKVNRNKKVYEQKQKADNQKRFRQNKIH